MRVSVLGETNKSCAMILFFLSFTDPPTIIPSSFMSVVNLAEGDNLTLSCNMSGNPAPTIRWVSDVALVGGTRWIQSVSYNGYFVKSHFEQNGISLLYDKKRITCIGNNSVGMIEKSTQLNVRCKLD